MNQKQYHKKTRNCKDRSALNTNLGLSNSNENDITIKN